ncbi:trypsin-like peptidase domain-containing protein [Nereida sp. NH-UV-3]|uniref:trypsin-like peptidase domain-containing protein n=1 Tax=Nereida TaxID=282198 RepID=UPI0036F40FBA
MTRRVCSFVLGLVLSVVSLSTVHAFSDVVNSIESGVARIITDEGVGSGFVVTEISNDEEEALIVVTNEHVVKGSRSVQVAFKTPLGMLSYRGEVLNVDQRRDLAVIKINRKKNTRHDISILELANRETAKSEKVAKLGYPGLADRGLSTITSSNDLVDATFSEGIVSRLMTGSWYERDLPLRIILHTAPLNSGDSGGPLFDACGQVVGVNTNKSAAIDGDIPSGAFWASSSLEVLAFLRETDLPMKIYRSSCGSKGAIGFLSSPLVQIFLASVVVVGLGGIIFWQMTGRSGAADTNEDFAAIYIYASENGQINKFGVSEDDLSRGIELGREASCAIRFGAGDISRVHAKLCHRDGKLMFTDNGSSNKSYIDGREVIPHQDQHIGLNTEVQLGQSVQLRFKKAS